MNTLYSLRTFALSILVALSVTAGCNAQNPIIQTNFTADPTPMVYNGTVYLYTSHDEDDATGFHMLDWKLYTSTDMVNWTDHGAVASLATFPWAMRSNEHGRHKRSSETASFTSMSRSVCRVRPKTL
jgi:arabinoxylan arabinofuranohydrolase